MAAKDRIQAIKQMVANDKKVVVSNLSSIFQVTEETIRRDLEKLEDEKEYGFVLRSKGMVPSGNSKEWIYFDYVPGEADVRTGKPDVTGKICVIGSKLLEENLNKLFMK